MFKTAFLGLALATTSTTVLAKDPYPVEVANSQLHEAQQSARTSLLAAERVLFAAKQAIDAASVIISSIDNDRLIHTELARLAQGVPGARAIIVIGPDGTLIHDSYRYPATELDLSERAYFKEAIAHPGFTVGRMVVGKTSGANFVPLVKRLGDQTIVIVASPFSLIDLQSSCASCWNLVLQNDGDVVTMFPPEARVSKTLTEMVSRSTEKEGTQIVRYHNSVVAVAWRKSSDFPITLMAVRGIVDTATGGIDLN